MTLLNICNPENRRYSGFKAAYLERHKCIQALEWNTLLSQPIENSIPHGSTIRIDSPGENFEVWKKIVQLGMDENNGYDKTIVDPQDDHGCWRYHKQWASGWSTLLQRIHKRSLIAQCNIFGNRPMPISTCFNKSTCSTLLTKHGIPTPPTLIAQNYQDLNNIRESLKWSQLYVKTNAGSSASGIAAVRWKKDGTIHAQSTLTGIQNDQINNHYNSLKIRQYRGKEAIYLINTILAEGAIIERWIPKIGFQDHICDIRWYICNGNANHCVVRGSKSTFTNLHLGNKRINTTDFIAHIGQDTWELTRTHAINAAKILQINSAGIDVMVSTTKDPYILDINAFGDLLPGIEHQNRNTWQEQVHQFS